MADLPEVTAGEAIARLADGAWLIDVREEDEWDRGHARGAHLVPLSRLQQLMATVPSDQPVLVVCQAGSRSMRASKTLSEAGYNPVNVMGGMLAWAAAGGALEAAPGTEPRI